jgi:hypothetical protein
MDIKMNLIAKPIIENQYWIVTDGKNKIGNIQINNDYVNFNINNKTEQYTDISSLTKSYNINFQQNKKENIKGNIIYSDYPVSDNMYNTMVDLQKKIQLYTKTPDSKSYYVAGYFNINMNDSWETHYCPKYIYIQRYPYDGPFRTVEECKKLLKKYDKY